MARPRCRGFTPPDRGVEIIRRVGVERIRERSLALTQRLIAGAREHGWRVGTPEADRNARRHRDP